MNNELKELRERNHFTQQQAADFLGVSLRSYKSYENEESKKDTIKYRYMVDKLKEESSIDEEHGLLTIEDIKNTLERIFKDYDVEYCYLFGSYAKGTMNENSDVDLLISTKTKGLRFYGLAETIREQLHKRVDLLDVNQLKNNPELCNEILKDGIKIYG